MKFTIQTSALKREVDFCNSIAEKANTIPVLRTLRAEVANDKINLVGTDLDVTGFCDVAADVETKGELCIPAAELSAILKTSATDEIAFEALKGDRIQIKAGKATYKLACHKVADFPEIDNKPAFQATIPGAVLARLIRDTIFSITTEESRFTLSGAKLEIGGGKARMVATNGHRLSFCETDCDGEIDALIPKKALAVLRGLCGDDPVKIGVTNSMIHFESGGRLVSCRLLSGNFPNYQMVLPKDNCYSATFNTEAIRAAVGRIRGFVEGNRSIYWTLRDDECEFFTQGENEARETVETDYCDTPITFGCQVPYLAEYLAQVTTEQIRMSFKNATSQVELNGVGDAFTSRYIVMPLRL